MTQRQAKPTRAVLTFSRYITPQGSPTCAIDVSNKQLCAFLGSSHFGTREECLYPSSQESLHREPDSLGWLVPHKTCPMWIEQNKETPNANT